MPKDPNYVAHVAPAKKKVVEELVQLLEEYPVIGAVDIESLPAQQFQNMRAKFRENMVIRVAKKRVIQIAMKQAGAKRAGIEKLGDTLKGMPALIFTKDNPFKLYKNLDKNKSPAPAKGGQEAPKDVIVPAGPTSFAPGPIIGQLGQFGIKAGIEGGKIVIKEDSVAVKAGEVIGDELAGILTRLDIKPMEIGLNLTAAFEEGEVFDKSLLSVDEDKVRADVELAALQAFNVAVEVAYPTKDTMETLLGKAVRQARAVAISEGLPVPGVMEDVIARAHGSAQAVKEAANV